MNKSKKTGDLVDIWSKLIPANFRVTKVDLGECPHQERAVYWDDVKRGCHNGAKIEKIANLWDRSWKKR